MKTSTASILFAFTASLAVNSIPVRPEVQELSSRSSVPGIELRRGDDSIARRSPSFRHRRDDITMVEARLVTVEKREPVDHLPNRAQPVSATIAETTTANEAKRTLDVSEKREPADDLPNRAEPVTATIAETTTANEAKRTLDVSEREPVDNLPNRAEPVTATLTETTSAVQAKRTLELSSGNATASTYREVPIKERNPEPKKTVEPNCFSASSSKDAGCVVNLRG